jgi:hypothetical protein
VTGVDTYFLVGLQDSCRRRDLGLRLLENGGALAARLIGPGQSRRQVVALLGWQAEARQLIELGPGSCSLPPDPQ